MSHADDGTIHAYLDGELSALEVARLEAHVVQCAECRTRVDAERDVVARSTRLLARAAPPEREALPPPLESLRDRATPSGRHVGLPLGLAAGLIIAVAAGWFAVRQFPPAPTAGPQSRAMETYDRGSDLTGGVPMVTDTSGTTSREVLQAESMTVARARSEVAGAVTAPQAPRPAAAPQLVDTVRTRADAMIAAERSRAENRAVAVRDSIARPPAQPAPSGAMGIPEAAAEGRASLAPTQRRAASETIEVDSARTLLSGDVFAVPELPVKAVRREHVADNETTVVVEQLLDSTQTIRVVHRRLEPAAAGYSTRARRATQRRVGSTDVEILGPLPTDSLVRLLDRLRAIR